MPADATPLYQRFRWKQVGITVAVLLAVWSAFILFWPPGVHEQTEIFEGVTYEAVALNDVTDAEGLMHLVSADLTNEAVELYVSPLCPGAQREGGQYRLAPTWWAAWQENLSVAVNGTLFHGHTRWHRPGEVVQSLHTLIADGEVSHVNAYTSMIWTDEEGTLHITPESPPPRQVQEEAVWGVGGLLLSREANTPSKAHEPNRRTLLGADTTSQTLYLAVFEHASYAAAWKVLRAAGVEEALVLDGGSSSTIYLSLRAATWQKGLLVGGIRPVATHVGVRAQPVPRSAR